MVIFGMQLRYNEGLPTAVQNPNSTLSMKLNYRQGREKTVYPVFVHMPSIKVGPEAEVVFDDKYQYSCVVATEESILLIGGFTQPTQISLLTSFGLHRIGTLPFDAWHATCTLHKRQMHICFDMHKQKICRQRLENELFKAI